MIGHHVRFRPACHVPKGTHLSSTKDIHSVETYTITVVFLKWKKEQIIELQCSGTKDVLFCVYL